MRAVPPMFIIGVLFFIFGFISWLNAILIPYFKLSLQLSLGEAMLVTFAFYLSYFVMALPSSYILRRTGYKKGMSLGLLVMAAGALVFVPAAQFSSYPLFLTGLLIQATGLTLLQTASNPYVTILGPIDGAASRMSLMGVCNKVAGALAPLLFVGFVTKSPHEVDEVKAAIPHLPAVDAAHLLRELILRLRTPYIFIAFVFVALGMFIYFSALPDIKTSAHEKSSNKKLSDYPHLLLGVFAIFCGVSAEVIAVDTIINYAESTGSSFASARYFATYTLLIMIVAYIAGIISIPKYISQHKALSVSAFSGLILTVGVLALPGHLSVWIVALLGFCNALIWPSIWPLALKDLGNYTSKGSALLIMGIVGGAITPFLYGSIAAELNTKIAYIVLLPLYLFLLYYGRKGYQVVH